MNATRVHNCYHFVYNKQNYDTKNLSLPGPVCVVCTCLTFFGERDSTSIITLLSARRSRERFFEEREREKRDWERQVGHGAMTSAPTEEEEDGRVEGEETRRAHAHALRLR